MINLTRVEWAEKTWNPVFGCRRVSPGCDNYHAIKEAHREEILSALYNGLTIDGGERINWIERSNVALPVRADERGEVLPA